MIAGAATLEGFAILVIISLVILIVYTLWWAVNASVRWMVKKDSTEGKK